MASAALFANYTHAEFKPGLKVCRIVLEIPQEKRKEFFDAFGYPDPANPVPVFIARRAKDAVAEPLSTGAPAPERSEPKAYSRSQVAFLKLKDPVFCNWLEALVGNGEPADPDTLLKYHLGITSKAQMDIEGHHSQKRWDSLLTDFDYRDRA